MSSSDQKSKEPDYDIFLSHASEDKVWCAMLAERLRNANVRVWYDAWEIKPGHKLMERINDGLKRSRKMVVVWTPSYFRDEKVWTRAESFSQQNKDLLGRDRLLIPLLREDCQVEPTFNDYLYMDFRNDDDFELRFRQLLEALDLPKPDEAREDSALFRHPEEEQEGKARHDPGKRFADDVASLYRLLGFEVTPDTETGAPILMISKMEGMIPTRAVVACHPGRVRPGELKPILVRQESLAKESKHCPWIAVSASGFSLEALLALENAGITCTTYAELLEQLVPLRDYTQRLITEQEQWMIDRWQGNDWFIRPDVMTDITGEIRPALLHFADWMGDPRARLLTLLGDLGTGKTTLARFLSYNLAQQFLSDPVRHPAPVRIPLQEVRKDISLESILIYHFSSRGLPGLVYPRFEYLMRNGKVLLLFDAFDEMADRIRWETTQSNFRELRRAAEQKGKVILTCRTHYFKDRNEQAKVIGVGPRLSELETALYRELREETGAEVVYLQEFDDAKIQSYLQKVRPGSEEEDWAKIQTIYNLKDLAHRPLLLDMIVKTLPQLKQGQAVDAARLYTIYTNFWIDREERKERFLHKEVKPRLMQELAWRMWHEEKDDIHYKELASFVHSLMHDPSIALGDEEAEVIAAEMQAATFLKRDEEGNFTFVHRSFMEFFLAQRLHACLTILDEEGKIPRLLNTRRFDRKIIYFLTLLDTQNAMITPLQAILTSAYRPNLSENALQLLYWSERIRAGMEEKISDHEALRGRLAPRIPVGAQLSGANLQEIVLEGAILNRTDLTEADLTNANLNHSHLISANCRNAKMAEARVESGWMQGVDFRGANLTDCAFTGTRLIECDFTGATLPLSGLIEAILEDYHGVGNEETFERKRLKAMVQRGHGFSVRTLAYSPNGELLATGGEDGLIILYRVRDGRLLRVLEGHEGYILSVSLSGDGRLLASGSDDQTIRLWDVRSGKLLHILQGHTSYVSSVSLSGDGRLLASGSSDKTVRLWEVESGKSLHILRGHESSVTMLSLSRDGRLLASGSGDSAVRLWEVESGKPLHILLGHENSVTSLSLSGDGRLLASGSNDYTVRLWEVESGKFLCTLQGHTSSVSSVSLSGDGRLLASGDFDKTIRLWEVENGKPLHILRGHDSSVTSLSLSGDGKVLTSGSWDSTVRLWEVGSGKSLRILRGHDSSVTSLSLSRDGRLLASGSTDKTIRLWEVESGKPLHICQGHLRTVTSVILSGDGRLLASGSNDYTARLWEVGSGKTLHILQGHWGYVSSVSLSGDGKVLASGSDDQTVRLWEVGRGKSLHTLKGHTRTVTSVNLSSDGIVLASGSSDSTVRLWEVGRGKSLHTLKGHMSSVSSVNLSSDGKVLASGSSDSTVRLWEVESGTCLGILEGHLGPVSTVLFAPNGLYLVAAGIAGRLQFWDWERQETFLYRYDFGPRVWLELLPDGRFNASPEGMRYLCYTERDSLRSFAAEELVKEFYDPKAVQEVRARYLLGD
ncbi:MAG TPA: TIR domain-containing protein [Chthonomonadaceae bacterium]|nr:TIR domain-containing protein [Chthonomonadaceae bacterium]